MKQSTVVDASALIDLLVEGQTTDWVADQLTDRTLHAPGHVAAEILTALHGMVRRGRLLPESVDAILRRVAVMPVDLVDLRELLVGTWARRDQHSLTDALYVELAAQLDTVVVTTDRRLARATPLAVAPPD
jgi:predicted nucleic acid-binding protein